MTKLVSPGVYVREVDLSDFVNVPLYEVTWKATDTTGRKWYKLSNFSVEVADWIIKTINNGAEIDGNPILSEEQYTMLLLKFPPSRKEEIEWRQI